MSLKNIDFDGAFRRLADKRIEDARSSASAVVAVSYEHELHTLKLRTDG